MLAQPRPQEAWSRDAEPRQPHRGYSSQQRKCVTTTSDTDASSHGTTQSRCNNFDAGRGPARIRVPRDYADVKSDTRQRRTRRKRRRRPFCASLNVGAFIQCNFKAGRSSVVLQPRAYSISPSKTPQSCEPRCRNHGAFHTLMPNRCLSFAIARLLLQACGDNSNT